MSRGETEDKSVGSTEIIVDLLLGSVGPDVEQKKTVAGDTAKSAEQTDEVDKE